MTADGMVSIRRPIRRANRWVKWRTSRGMSSRPLAQGRQHQREDVQPVVEVLAEAAVGDHPGQVAVGGRHQRARPP